MYEIVTASTPSNEISISVGRAAPTHCSSSALRVSPASRVVYTVRPRFLTAYGRTAGDKHGRDTARSGKRIEMRVYRTVTVESPAELLQEPLAFLVRLLCCLANVS